MKQFSRVSVVFCSLLALSIARSLQAADYPAPKEGSWTVRDVRFHTGETLPELRLHYTTVGSTSGEAVLLLHGTDGSAASLLNPGFAGELFGPGQPLEPSGGNIIWQNFFAQRNKRRDRAALMRSLHERNEDR
jgi:homoserine O-acetyltransferase